MEAPRIPSVHMDWRGLGSANDMKLNVFGRVVQVERTGSSWKAYYVGSEGKRRPADDIVIPDHITDETVIEYIEDLCHEWATPKNDRVSIIG